MKRVALIIGHTPLAVGAVNPTTNETEFDFNNEFVPKVAKQLRIAGYQPVIVYRDTYSNLPAFVNQTGADIGISFHCNAFNTEASGCEMLYWFGSSKGKGLAECLQKKVVSVLGNNDRGIKPIDYDTNPAKNDNGGWLVEKTSMPVVISEPFFIDNQYDLGNVKMRYAKLVNAYVDGVKQYYGEI